MHTSYWGFLFAMAIGGMSQFIKDAWPSAPTWVAPGLFWLCALLAVGSLVMFMIERGWLQWSRNHPPQARRYARDRVDRARDAVRSLAIEWQNLPARLMMPDMDARRTVLADLRGYLTRMQVAVDDFVSDEKFGPFLIEIDEHATAVLMLSDVRPFQEMAVDELATHQTALDTAVSGFLDATHELVMYED